MDIFSRVDERIMKNYLFFSLFILMSFATDVVAQQYPFRQFTSENGLPKNMVAGMAQDESGLLWIGTSGGICSFDGHHFKQLETTSNIDYFYAKSFFRDSRGDFWLGMQGNGLVYVHNNKAVHLGLAQGLPDLAVWAIVEDRHQNLWIGTGKGLVILRAEDRAKETMLFQPVFEVDFAGIGIYRMVEDSGGRLWINSDSGLYLVDDGRILRHWPEVIHGRCLASHPEGFVLAFLPEGLYRFDGDSSTLFFRCPQFARYSINDIILNGHTVWIATYGQGLIKLENGQLETIRLRNGLFTEYLYSLYVDQEGSLWIGSIHGLSQLHETAFINYTKQDGLLSNSVHEIEEDARGRIYLAGDDGISIIDTDTIFTQSITPATAGLHRINDLKKTPTGDGIIAMCEMGAKYYVSVRSQKVTVKQIASDPKSSRGMRVELRDRFDNYWKSTPADGIFCTMKNGERRHWSIQNGLPTNQIFDVAEDTSGAVWFSTIGEGLLRYSQGTFRHYTIEDGLPSNHIEMIFVHPKTKQIWITSNNGPARWHPVEKGSDFVTFPDVQKLPAKDFSAIAADQNGHLWFTSSAGVVRYDGTQFELFTKAHGLIGISPLGIFLDHSGCIWVGGPKGATKIYPDRLQQPVMPPRIYLSQVESSTRVLTDLRDLRLPHGENNLRLTFWGLNLRYPDGLKYSYRLFGLDDVWSEFTPQNSVHFPVLPPGEYRFQVRARNIRSVVSSELVEFRFAILSPIWQRWWFIASAILICFFAGRSIYLWRIHQLLAVERLRTRIAADLHDDIASSLASIALYSEVVQRQLKASSEDIRSLLKRIRDLSRNVMEDIGIIIWTANPRYDQVGEVLAYFQRYGAELCTAAGVAFHAYLPEKIKPLVLTPERRRTLYLILKEGLNNILHHAHCSQVKFKCTLLDRQLEIRLQDNGQGFELDTEKMGLGLSSMRQRAQSIGADFQIESHAGTGTTLLVRLKIA
jgi:signal transduction histidine kinase/ligand-binding sensor domain-containing protein